MTVGTPCNLPWWLKFINCKKFGGAELDFNNSRVKNLTRATELTGNPLPEDLVHIVESGGILQLLKQEGQASA